MIIIKFKLTDNNEFEYLKNIIKSNEYCFYIPKNITDFYILSMSKNYLIEFEVVFKDKVLDIEQYNPSNLEIFDWHILKSVGYSVICGMDNFDIFGSSETI